MVQHLGRHEAHRVQALAQQRERMAAQRQAEVAVVDISHISDEKLVALFQSPLSPADSIGQLTTPKTAVHRPR